MSDKQDNYEIVEAVFRTVWQARQMNGVQLTYDSGFPTRLEQHPQLAGMLRDLGEPVAIRRLGRDYILEWRPIFPGVPVPTYRLRDPWPGETPGRALVGVALSSDDAR
jgi:hypothetical protein